MNFLMTDRRGGFSGDADSVVPVTSTRYSLDALKQAIKVPWYAWYHHEQVRPLFLLWMGSTTCNKLSIDKFILHVWVGKFHRLS